MGAHSIVFGGHDSPGKGAAAPFSVHYILVIKMLIIPDLIELAQARIRQIRIYIKYVVLLSWVLGSYC